VIFGILIRNSLQSLGHMLLLVFNNGKSSCFEVGFDFGETTTRGIWSPAWWKNKLENVLLV
jgi:predicted transcriptional regulator